MRTRVVIIGAGVVGLAVAERLSRRIDEIVVLDRSTRPGQGTSSRNSQVLHSGLYYPPGSLKAQLCVAGNRSLTEWCAAHDVPLRRVGKLIVAESDLEAAELPRLARRAEQNGVFGITALDGKEVRALEPAVRAQAGLWVPSTGVLDVHALLGSFERAAVERGVTLALRHEVLGLDRTPSGWALEIGSSGERFRLEAEVVVNAAGLHADAIAQLAGLDVDALGYRQHWVKGRYARLRAPQRFEHLVYPVPPATLTGLGVHLTIGLDGQARLGPDVVPLQSPLEDYTVDEDCLGGFLEAGRHFLPWLELEHLAVDTAGIRPKLAPAGGPWRDFVVREEGRHGCPGLITLAGIESPGLTSSIELAALVDALAASD